MGSLLKDALRSLCVEIGWTYAVFWRAIGSGDQMHLIWGDGHCERTSSGRASSGSESMDLLIRESGLLRSSNNGSGGFSEVYKLMATQVHVVGDGMVGKAACTGNHEWIIGDMLNGDQFAKMGSITSSKMSSLTGSVGLAGIGDQLLAGIKTITIIPVLPHGVVQLGSSQMVLENIRFVNHVKSLFGQLGCVQGAPLSYMPINILNQNAHLHTSFGMQTSLSQFGVGTGTKNSSPPTGSNGNCQPSKYSSSSGLIQPSCASPMEFCSAANAPTVPFVKENVSSMMMPLSNFPQPVHRVVKSNVRLNSLSQGPQVMNSSADAGLFRNALPYDPVSGRLYHPSVVLPPRKSWELANKDEPNLSNSNVIQSHECEPLVSLQVSNIISSIGKSTLQSSTKDPEASNSFSNAKESIGQFVDSSILEEPGVLNKTICTESRPIHPASIGTEAQILSFNVKEENGDVFQALESLSNVFEPNCCSNLMRTNHYPQDGPVQNNLACGENSTCTSQNKNDAKGKKMMEFHHNLEEKTLLTSPHSSLGNDLFDALRLDHNTYGYPDSSLDDAIVYGTDPNVHELGTDVSTCIAKRSGAPVFDVLGSENCEIVPETDGDQLLDAVVAQINRGAKLEIDDNASCRTSLTQICTSSPYSSSPSYCCVPPSKHMLGETFLIPPVHVKSEPAASSSGNLLPPFHVKSEPAASCSGKSSCSIERNEGYKSQINSWIENGQNMDYDNISAAQCKRVEELVKPNKKRSRPGESPRPRPKDRQMIQDRVKELREIVPNGAKCSIDALLEKTIKHMLFLQSVTKHADKLKESGELKIISKEGGLLLKDNFEGGATWAFEVGSQSMICPIVVEDLGPPRQMLVEMLCEEQGLFLEIADLVRGLGLTILRGVLEVRKDKVWARFAVEASRDVTRMDIFISLMRLLEPSATSSKAVERPKI